MTRVVGPFLATGSYLNILGRSPLGAAKYQTYMQIKHVIPKTDLFGSMQGHNLNKFGRNLLGDATYQIPRLYALWFQPKRLFCFPYISQGKHMTPGRGHSVWPKGHNLSKFGRRPLCDATYQISRLSRRCGLRQEKV